LQVNQVKNKKTLAIFTAILITIIITSSFAVSTLAVKPVPVTLDPKTIPKYVNQLVVPPVFTSSAGTPTYTILMDQARQQVLPIGTPLIGSLNNDGLTSVWGYKGNSVAKGATLGVPDGTLLTDFIHSPSSTFEITRGTPVTVKWVNNLASTTIQPFAVDPTLNWANPTGAFPDGDIFSATGGPFITYPPGYIGQLTNTAGQPLNAQSPVPLVTHLHGAEVQGEYDGGPEAWWTSNGLTGPNFATYTDATYTYADSTTYGGSTLNAATYYYPNAQEPNTLWYHDHALGITRINVMSGLAGFYLLREPTTGTPITALTAANLDEYLTSTFQYGVSEIPIAIQDRTFKTNGEFWYPEVGINPTIHPYWMPEFFGDTIMVNGQVWPNLDVTPGWYRFRILDGSNARFYTLSFNNKMPFTVIGEDGGFTQAPVVTNTYTIAPGERVDILVQFTQAMLNNKIVLTNTAKAPFPNGAKADPQTTGQVMQFTVKPTGTAVTQGVTSILPLPAALNPTLPSGAFPTLPAATNTRYITLNEVMGPAGPVMVTINGQYFNAPVSENPQEGTTEEWVIINLTADAHPIHTHLVTYQLVSRQQIQATKYTTDWLKLQLDTTTNTLVAPPFPRYFTPVPLNPTAYLQGKQVLPTPAEMTWKDTIQVYPGEVTVLRVRFTSQDGTVFPFDPTTGAYVYHCHILDHEDNEMMRPFTVTNNPLIIR
jgi:spore coat protein A